MTSRLLFIFIPVWKILLLSPWVVTFATSTLCINFDLFLRESSSEVKPEFSLEKNEIQSWWVFTWSWEPKTVSCKLYTHILCRNLYFSPKSLTHSTGATHASMQIKLVGCLSTSTSWFNFPVRQRSAGHKVQQTQEATDCCFCATVGFLDSVFCSLCRVWVCGQLHPVEVSQLQKLLCLNQPHKHRPLG